ncbi:MAG: protein phosphatase CheZ [Nitrospirota bacterium]|nr:protein phosphatase CheZ [Nitrospirota bacterium]
MADHDIPARTGASVRQMIGFRLGAEKFAIDIGKIHEIVKPRPVTLVPDVPAGYSGMIHLRDRVVLMADLHRRFGLPPYKECKDGRIIVLEREDQPVGILVDAVSEVVRLQPHMIEPTPRFYNGVTVDFIEAVGKQNGALITILNTEALFAAPPVPNTPPLSILLEDDREEDREDLEHHDPSTAESLEALTSDATDAMATGPAPQADESAEADTQPSFTDDPSPGEPEPAMSAESPEEKDAMKKIDKSALHDELYQDIGHLARYINRAHQSFNQEMQEDDDPIRVKAKDLPTANDILQQVTLDTEAATMRIISAVEETNTTLGTLKGMMEELDEALPASSKQRDKVSDIIDRMRAELAAVESLQDQTLITLSFQDLTGQKIRQVIRLMMEIEERILALVVKFGINVAEDAETAVEEKLDSLRAKPDPMLRQDKVDNLLAEFGF